jgi:hypothetical protein
VGDSAALIAVNQPVVCVDDIADEAKAIARAVGKHSRILWIEEGATP